MIAILSFMGKRAAIVPGEKNRGAGYLHRIVFSTTDGVVTFLRATGTILMPRAMISTVLSVVNESIFSKGRDFKWGTSKTRAVGRVRTLNKDIIQEAAGMDRWWILSIRR